MPDNVLDLDILRPKPRIVMLDGKEIDVSFVPCAITFEVDEITAELRTFKEKEILAAGKESKRAFELGVKLCSLFACVQHNYMTEKWFSLNTSPEQIGALADEIHIALLRSYEGVTQYQKKTEATSEK